MKKLLFILVAVSLSCACRKKVETPDYSALIVGKWVCNSYKNDDVDTITYRRPYSLSGVYESEWWFSTDKQVQYKLDRSDWFSFKKDSYILVENKELTINSETINGDFYTYNYTIIEFTASKFTVYSKFWRRTFFLVRQ
jgi:hypothetical protein